MRNKLIMMLAVDALLESFDRNYEGVEKETFDLLNTKVLESYGLKINSSKEEIEQMRKTMIEDIYEFRNDIITDVLLEEKYQKNK